MSKCCLVAWPQMFLRLSISAPGFLWLCSRNFACIAWKCEETNNLRSMGARGPMFISFIPWGNSSDLYSTWVFGVLARLSLLPTAVVNLTVHLFQFFSLFCFPSPSFHSSFLGSFPKINDLHIIPCQDFHKNSN